MVLAVLPLSNIVIGPFVTLPDPASEAMLVAIEPEALVDAAIAPAPATEAVLLP